MPSKLFWRPVSAIALAALCEGCHRPSSENGAMLYRKHCAHCHTRQPGQASPAPGLGAYFNRHPQPSVPEVKKLIREGKGAMPPFDQQLSSHDLDDLVAYLKTLR
jgi:mono/diheme cytochrome c family protein